jgi:hypothetical protein
MTFTLECMNEALDNKQLDDAADVRKLDAHAVVTRRDNVANLSEITNTVVADVRESDDSPAETVVKIVDDMLRAYYNHPEIHTDLPEPGCDWWDEQIAAEIYNLEHTWLKGIVSERDFHAECPADTLEAGEIADASDEYTETQEVEEDEIDAKANGKTIQVKSSKTGAKRVDTSDDSPVDLAVFPSENEPCGWRGLENNSLTGRKGENTWDDLGLSG